MTKNQFKKLSRGDIVRHVAGGISYIVDANFGDSVTALNSIDVTNPTEWDLVFKASYRRTKKRM